MTNQTSTPTSVTPGDIITFPAWLIKEHRRIYGGQFVVQHVASVAGGLIALHTDRGVLVVNARLDLSVTGRSAAHDLTPAFVSAA